ncbi:MAG: universal stress protein [Nitrospiraceae bacterium]|nr:universal stress protein [Nitrospiraceae bacterium]
MKKILVAVDDTKGSTSVLATCHNLIQRPEAVILLHVERLEGKSLMIDMLGESELATLRESLEGTEHKERLDRRAEKILLHYRTGLEESGQMSVKTVVRDGHPADQILRVAEEEGVDLIILGHSGSRGLNRLITGSVARDVKRKAGVPVLVAKKAIMCEEPYRWKDAYAAISVTTAVVLGLFLLGIILQRGIFLP